MEPSLVGRYRVVRELGRGSMGRVYLAHDPEIDRLVAIKSIQVFASLPERDRQAARDRFLREARSAGKLLHPGIVTVFDVGESEGVPYLAMEYVEGLLSTRTAGPIRSCPSRSRRRSSPEPRRRSDSPTPPGSCTGTSSRRT